MDGNNTRKCNKKKPNKQQRSSNQREDEGFDRPPSEGSELLGAKSRPGTAREERKKVPRLPLLIHVLDVAEIKKPQAR
jgi:hypothetical protein